MMIKLPESFVERMSSLLGEELEAFLNSYEDDYLYGLRVNTLKISVEDFLKITPFRLTPIPWTRDGFYYEADDRPTKHPHYHAGLYYIQEPSAMAPVNVLGPESEDFVLDMCACPGGKSVQIASYLGPKGLLVSNDVSATRIKALIKNIEMMGITNVLVINTTEEVIGTHFKGFFDRLLIDAPCSGEGMFRKDPKMVGAWDTHNTTRCRTMQDSILKAIGSTLKDGGEMVYSTCTFSSIENEDALEAFMDQEPSYRLEPLDSTRFSFVTNRGYGRLWPHKIMGEGHFVAKLKKTDGVENRPSTLADNSPPECFQAFAKDNLNIVLTGHFEEMNGKLYWRPPYDIRLKGVRVVRYGWLLGEVKGKKFVPSQALPMALKKEDFQRTLDFSADSIEVIKYLKGETLHIDGADGITLICVDGYPLGLGKMQGNTLKNMYETSWRLQ